MGPILPKPVTTKILERKETKLFHVGVGFMNGYREKMEDAHTVMPVDDEGWGFFGVFDGHCGPLCSKYVAKRFPELIPNYTIPIPDDKLQELSLQIDGEFLARHEEGGSTGTYMFVIKKDDKYHLQVSNVGDSRIILGRKSSRSEESLTEDHKPLNPPEKMRIELAGGMVSNNRVDGGLAVSRAFGDANYKNAGPHDSKVVAVPEITHVDAEAGDFVLLACDGVFENDVFTNASVIEFIFQQLETTSDLAHISAAVCDEAMNRGSKDNISAMIVQFADVRSSGRPELEVRAGPMSMPSSLKFCDAYEMMAAEVGMTIEECIELRYDQVADTLREQYQEKKYQGNICDLNILSDSDIRFIAESHKVMAECREDRVAKLNALRDVTDLVDFRTPLIQQLEAEQKQFGIPTEVAELGKGMEERTKWFRGWLDGIAKCDGNYAKLALQMVQASSKLCSDRP